jgi:FkbM family methyltransferase
MGGFRQAWADGLATLAQRTLGDNFAAYRWGHRHPDFEDRRSLDSWRRFITGHLDDFEAAQALLEDEASREVMLRVLLFDALGHKHVRHDRNTPAYREHVRAIEHGTPTIGILERDVDATARASLHLYELRDRDVRVVCSRGFLINVLFNGQYDFERDGVVIRPEPGDVVLDCGGGFGETAILFARRVGPAGHVYSFEFVPENCERAERNRAHNPELAGRITPLPFAVHERSGRTLSFEDQGPGTRVGESGSLRVETLAIDDWVEQQGLDRVDWIKMDVEGSEAAALRGARRTLARFAPRLAISAYHRPDDLYVLPRLIRSLRPDYRLYLDHHTIHREETVLYARAAR